MCVWWLCVADTDSDLTAVKPSWLPLQHGATFNQVCLQYGVNGWNIAVAGSLILIFINNFNNHEWWVDAWLCVVVVGNGSILQWNEHLKFENLLMQLNENFGVLAILTHNSWPTKEFCSMHYTPPVCGPTEHLQHTLILNMQHVFFLLDHLSQITENQNWGF